MDTPHFTVGEQVPVDDLLRLVDRFSHRAGLSSTAHNILYTQIERLKAIYGASVDKAQAYAILAKHCEVTQTGRIRTPVDVVEFVESPEFMNQGAYVRPAILEHLWNLFKEDSPFYEVVLGGAIGIGKNYFADMAVSYILYQMSCLLSPQAYYGLAPGSEIVFVFQSKTLNLARKVVFNQFSGRLRASGYFPRNFNFAASHQAQMNFPHNISVIPVSSSATAALGMNIYCAVLDELNFMARTRKSKLSEFTGEDEYDQAEKLYTTILRRIESRYVKLGKIPGKVFLISSANYKGDFIDRKEKEAEEQLKETGKTHIYVMHLAQWEALPPTTYCGKKFWLLLPDEKFKGAILEEEPEEKENAVEVPVEYRADFVRNFTDSLRDIGGIAVARRNRLLDSDQVETAFTLYESRHSDLQIFSNERLVFDEISTLEQLIDIDFLRSIRYLGPFGAHVDLALTNDSAGIAIGYVVGSKDIGTRSVFDEERGKFVTKAYGDLPVYCLAGLLRIDPPRGGEIDLNVARDLLFLIDEYIGLKWVTFDQFQSAALMQAFRSRGIASYKVSVDKSPQAYREIKYALMEERLYIPRNTYFEKETRDLEQDGKSGKVDHITGGSKDVADAVAGVIFEFSNKRLSYRKKGMPEPSDVQPNAGFGRPSVGERPSSGRDPLYG